MAPNITIRNITNVPLELVLVEHFDPHQQEQSRFNLKNVTRGLVNVTNSIGLTNSTTRKAVPQLPPDAQPFERRDVNVQLPPFTIVTTDIPSEIRGSDERVRLTFQNGGERHQMYCPVPTAATHGLIPITENPQMHLVGIYLPEHAFAAIFSDSDLHAWMGKLGDHIPLGVLSIPGTHNAPTCHSAPPSVRCQAVSPWEQLQNGVRFFDLRVQVPEPFDPNSDKLVLVRSVFPISLTGNKYFRDLYNDCKRFLDENRSETLIISIKREGTGNGNDEQLSQILKNCYVNNDPDHWFTQPRVPTLGECRGKFVLVRRFNLEEGLKHENDNRGWGIDGSAWADNTPDAVCPSGDLRIQDFYEVLEEPSIVQKIQYARDHLERSGEVVANPEAIQNVQADVWDGNKFPIFVNFLSASNFWKVGTWPEKIAARVNPAVVEHLCKSHMVRDDGGVKDGQWATGVVVCDWVGLDGDWDLVRCIVGMNSKLQ